jgi:hypothetical protein
VNLTDHDINDNDNDEMKMFVHYIERIHILYTVGLIIYPIYIDKPMSINHIHLKWRIIINKKNKIKIMMIKFSSVTY